MLLVLLLNLVPKLQKGGDGGHIPLRNVPNSETTQLFKGGQKMGVVVEWTL